MGSGIAQVAATSGCKVKLYDTSQAALDKAKTALEKILNRLIEKGRIDADEKNRIQSNISYVDSLKDLSDSNLTIEAIIENLDIKKKVFSELESYVADDCIIASNTSSLSIASIAASLQKPQAKLPRSHSRLRVRPPKLRGKPYTTPVVSQAQVFMRPENSRENQPS